MRILKYSFYLTIVILLSACTSEVNQLNGDDIKVFIPNSFTPDAKVNSVFLPMISEPVNHYQFYISNSQTLSVFESSNQNFGWNGYFNGNLQSAGSYYYILKFEFKNESFTFKGHFDLIR